MLGGPVDGVTYAPFSDTLKQRIVEQMAKPNMVYPSRGEMETELRRNSAYLDGLTALFTKYNLTGWPHRLGRAPLFRVHDELMDPNFKAKSHPESKF